MHVYVNVLKRSVVVTGLVEQDGQLVGTEHMARVNSGQQLGGVTYRQLRQLGDGQHQLLITSREFVVGDDPSHVGGDELPTHWLSWVGYAAASFVLSAAGYGICWAVEFSESETRVHWVIATLYDLGGKDAVALAFIGLGGLFLLAAACAFFRTDPST